MASSHTSFDEEFPSDPEDDTHVLALNPWTENSGLQHAEDLDAAQRAMLIAVHAELAAVGVAAPPLPDLPSTAAIYEAFVAFGHRVLPLDSDHPRTAKGVVRILLVCGYRDAHVGRREPLEWLFQALKRPRRAGHFPAVLAALNWLRELQPEPPRSFLEEVFDTQPHEPAEYIEYAVLMEQRLRAHEVPPAVEAEVRARFGAVLAASRFDREERIAAAAAAVNRCRAALVAAFHTKRRADDAAAAADALAAEIAEVRAARSRYREAQNRLYARIKAADEKAERTAALLRQRQARRLNREAALAGVLARVAPLWDVHLANAPAQVSAYSSESSDSQSDTSGDTSDSNSDGEPHDVTLEYESDLGSDHSGVTAIPSSSAGSSVSRAAPDAAAAVAFFERKLRLRRSLVRRHAEWDRLQKTVIEQTGTVRRKLVELRRLRLAYNQDLVALEFSLDAWQMRGSGGSGGGSSVVGAAGGIVRGRDLQLHDEVPSIAEFGTGRPLLPTADADRRVLTWRRIAMNEEARVQELSLEDVASESDLRSVAAAAAAAGTAERAVRTELAAASERLEALREHAERSASQAAQLAAARQSLAAKEAARDALRQRVAAQTAELQAHAPHFERLTQELDDTAFLRDEVQAGAASVRSRMGNTEAADAAWSRAMTQASLVLTQKE